MAGDVSAVPICISDASSSPRNPDQVLSDDDLPTAMHAEDRQQVIRIRDVPPDVQVVDLSQDDQICDTRLAVWGAVMASAVSSRPEGWSSGMPRTFDVSREGPFDAYSYLMDTGDSPLVTTGLPGCPYRITSYTGPAVADTNPAFGMQLHHPPFLEFIGAPESARLLYHSPAFWIQRLGEEDV